MDKKMEAAITGYAGYILCFQQSSGMLYELVVNTL